MVKKHMKAANGMYHIRGQKYEMLEGSRAQVWHGTARQTPGNLFKSDLLMNKHGRIVSKRKHTTAKKEKRLVKAGYLTKKGKFGFIKGAHTKKHKSSKMKGGGGFKAPSTPQTTAAVGRGSSGSSRGSSSSSHASSGSSHASSGSRVGITNNTGPLSRNNPVPPEPKAPLPPPPPPPAPGASPGTIGQYVSAVLPRMFW